jgi:hypothetical protein
MTETFDSASVRNWKHPAEADLASAALAELTPYFTAEREVWGTHCTGRRLRLDAVLRPVRLGRPGPGLRRRVQERLRGQPRYAPLHLLGGSGRGLHAHRLG